MKEEGLKKTLSNKKKLKIKIYTFKIPNPKDINIYFQWFIGETREFVFSEEEATGPHRMSSKRKIR